jgi:hypothetical protein
VLIQGQGGSYVFQLATTVDGYGTFALEAMETGGQWGFAAGLNLGAGALSALPGLGSLSVFSGVSLTEMVLVASSFASCSFAFPAMSVFNDPALTGGDVVLPPQASGVVAGLNVYAKWTLGGSEREGLLQKALGLGSTLGITLQVGINPAANNRLFVSIQATLAGNPLEGEMGLQVQDGEPSLFLEGKLQTRIQGGMQIFEVVLAWVPNGAFITGSMQGSLTFGHLTLSNLLLAVGIDLEGVPSLGVAAELTEAGFDASLVVLLNSANPVQSVLAGAVNTTTLAKLYDVFTDHLGPSVIDDVLGQVCIVPGSPPFSLSSSLAPGLDGMNLDAVSQAFGGAGVTLPASPSQALLVVSTPGQEWFITDLTIMRHYQLALRDDAIQVSLEPQFYFAPESVSIGGFNFSQGIFIDAGLRVHGIEADVTVQIEPSQGLAVDAMLSPIVIGNGNLFSLTAAQGGGGPHFSVSTFHNPTAPQGLQDPHALINGKLTLLGATASVYANLTRSGFEFDLNGDLLHAIDFDLNGSFGGNTLTVGGSLGVSIGTIDLGILGKVTINAGVSVAVSSAALTPSYAFAGTTHAITTIHLDVSTATLAGLPAELLTSVEADLKSLFTDAEKWAEAVANGFVEGVGDVLWVLQHAFGLAEDEARRIWNEAQAVVEKVCAIASAAGVL